MKGICFFFSSRKTARQRKRRNDNDEYTRTSNLGRITAQSGPHAGKTARGVHRFSQLLDGQCTTRTRTMHQPRCSHLKTTSVIDALASNGLAVNRRAFPTNLLPTFVSD